MLLLHFPVFFVFFFLSYKFFMTFLFFCIFNRIDTSVAPLFYADQFLQISTSLPSRFVYGLGEHRAAFLHDVQWNTLTMWARDAAPVVNSDVTVWPLSKTFKPLLLRGLADRLCFVSSVTLD